jgi:hypothetical protein
MNESSGALSFGEPGPEDDTIRSGPFGGDTVICVYVEYFWLLISNPSLAKLLVDIHEYTEYRIRATKTATATLEFI